MIKTLRPWLLAATLSFAGTGIALAHSPIMSCFENEDKTVTCEAGYSDGAPSTGQQFAAFSLDGRLLFEDTFTDNSDYTFTPPDLADGFYVEFIGDAAHTVIIYNDEIYWLEP
jgi:hypothetical protein